MTNSNLPEQILQELELLKHDKSQYTPNEYRMALHRLKVKLANGIVSDSFSNKQLQIFNELLQAAKTT